MHRLSWLAAACISLAVAACASSPPTLVALPAATPPLLRASPDAGPTLRLRQVRVADYLDGFPVVVGRNGHVLVVAERTEWAERPSQGAGRVLRDALSQRLGASRVLISGDGRPAEAELSVELLALDPARDGLVLEARWSFACRATRQGHGGRTDVRVPLGAGTPQAVAAATSEALSRLADALADAVRCDGRS